MSGKRYNALGAHVFAGGYTLGMMERFDVLGHLETGNYGVNVARDNFGDGFPIYVDDWPDPEDVGEVDVLYGNPPCAPWSTLNQNSANWKEDPRLELSKRHLGALKAYRPKVWLWESTENTWRRGQEFIEQVVRECLAEGYAVNILLENALWHGIPQIRRRMMFCASRVRVEWPEPSFELPPTIGEFLTDAPAGRSLPEPHIEAWKAAVPGKSLRDAWESINPPEDRVYRYEAGRRMCVGRPVIKLRRLDPEGYAGAVIGHNYAHFAAPKFLSVGEIKRICGYPEDFTLQGDNQAYIDFLTRAVMPPVAAYVANACEKALEDDIPAGAEAWVTDHRDDPAETWPYFEGPPRPSKPAKTRGPRRVKARPEDDVINDHLIRFEDAAPDDPEPDEGQGSGDYIREILRDPEHGLTDERIAALVRWHYGPKRTTKVADVAFNRRRMFLSEGIESVRNHEE